MEKENKFIAKLGKVKLRNFEVGKLNLKTSRELLLLMAPKNQKVLGEPKVS